VILPPLVLPGHGMLERFNIFLGRVGPPLYGVDIKLVDWEDGGYRVTDAVGPRGEIVIGGLHVAKGYYNMPEQTEKDFYDADGKRWFKSGDIGQVPDRWVVLEGVRMLMRHMGGEPHKIVL